MSTRPRRVVVVGGGIAGVSACGELRSRGFDGEIVLVEAGEEPYDRPPLSKGYLTGGTGDEALRLRPAGWYEQHAVRLRAGVTATALDTGAGRVELDDGSAEPADAVLLALGGRPRPLRVPGGDDAVHLLRTVQDARRLRRALRPGVRVLVVGGGLIGAEVASTAVVLGCQVVLTDPVLPLAAAVGEQVAAALHAQHVEHGIEVRTGGVERIERIPGAAAWTVHLTGGQAVQTDVIVAGIGIEPETGLAERAGLEVDRGVVVDAAGRTTNPAVFAAGDAARRRGAARVEHWEAAQHGGVAAAAGILGQSAEPAGAPWFWSDRHGCHVEAVGAPSVGAAGVVRGELGKPPYAVFHVRDGRCVGAVAVDDPRAVRAARRLIERAIPVETAALADPAVDLRRLVRG